MYKFIMVSNSCGSNYDLNQCEAHANKMANEGYDLFQVYQSNTAACIGSSKSVLVMVFKKR